MDSDVWQRLLALESRDIVSQWFERIHSRQLNARRAKEIVASARQGREFFRGASVASFAVRPLLAFYGVASLCRSVTLLHRRESGEEGMAKGHGIETVAWADKLSGDLSVALGSIGDLRIRTCKGLFSDLVADTQNRALLHVYDETIKTTFEFGSQKLGQELALADILDRLPDLIPQRSEVRSAIRCVRVNEFKYSPEVGAAIIVYAKADHWLCAEFAAVGYTVAEPESRYSNDGALTSLTIDDDGFLRHFPQLLHTYVYKTMGHMPSPHLVSEFAPGVRYSQIAVTYMLAYFLGMLARYYPTHWSALMSGEKGDAIWPSINAAQKYVETALPELVLELIGDSLRQLKNEDTVVEAGEASPSIAHIE